MKLYVFLMPILMSLSTSLFGVEIFIGELKYKLDPLQKDTVSMTNLDSEHTVEITVASNRLNSILNFLKSQDRVQLFLGEDKTAESLGGFHFDTYNPNSVTIGIQHNGRYLLLPLLNIKDHPPKTNLLKKYDMRAASYNLGSTPSLELLDSEYDSAKLLTETNEQSTMLVNDIQSGLILGIEGRDSSSSSTVADFHEVQYSPEGYDLVFKLGNHFAYVAVANYYSTQDATCRLSMTR